MPSSGSISGPISCFDLLDRHVVAGRAEHPAVRTASRTWTYARLLEEVSAFGGALRHCGVVAGDVVRVALPESLELVVAVLAGARTGAVPRLSDTPGDGPVLVTASTEAGVLREATEAVVLVAQRADAPWELREGRDYAWDVVVRAGRTDPAPLVGEGLLAIDDPRVAAWAHLLADGATVDLSG